MGLQFKVPVLIIVIDLYLLKKKSYIFIGDLAVRVTAVIKIFFGVTIVRRRQVYLSVEFGPLRYRSLGLLYVLFTVGVDECVLERIDPLWHLVGSEAFFHGSQSHRLAAACALVKAFFLVGEGLPKILSMDTLDSLK